MIDLADINQRLEKLLETGTIDEVKLNPLRYRVKFSSSRQSYWLRHGFQRMASSASWDPYVKGEQVLCARPGGGRQGVVICAVDSDQHGQHSNSPDVFRRDMPDGAMFEYNSKSHQLNITLPAAATTNFISQGGINMKGPLAVDGPITSTKDITDKKSSMDDMRDTYNTHATGNHVPPAPEMT
ncbi:phage baseplate assembly protein V [Endozoicomonas ascidiicola]|uniref:phage baseplate assembly protein V n=1 Tax=Endozoicomonas ascidiicola TaxID=1698521 RepID=UPI000834CA8D|nr:phage baseplate assembly protein V [Endozoicomonas ascidiicola]